MARELHDYREPMLRAEILDDVAAAEAVYAEWDRLATEARRPFCSPAWMLAWWRNARPDGAHLRVVAIFEDDDLVGVGPFFSIRTRSGIDELRFLGSRTSVRAEPLAVSGREEDVAVAIVNALGRIRPTLDLVLFEGVPTRSPWPYLFHDVWAREKDPTGTAPTRPSHRPST